MTHLMMRATDLSRKILSCLPVNNSPGFTKATSISLTSLILLSKRKYLLLWANNIQPQKPQIARSS